MTAAPQSFQQMTTNAQATALADELRDFKPWNSSPENTDVLLTKIERFLRSLPQPSEAIRKALEAAREYIDDDVVCIEPGWRSAKTIVEAIDAALSKGAA